MHDLNMGLNQIIGIKQIKENIKCIESPNISKQLVIVYRLFIYIDMMILL